MLTTIRNETGQLRAVCSWWVVDDTGRPDPNGVAVFVDQLDLSDGTPFRPMFSAIIQDILLRTPVHFAYWQRRLRTGSTIHCFTRRQLQRMVQKEVMV